LSGESLTTIQQVVFVTKMSNNQQMSYLTYLQTAFSFTELLNQLAFQNKYTFPCASILSIELP
jgi:hypothetical protein